MSATSEDLAQSQSLTLAGAQRVLDAALSRADELDLRFCVVVADPTGEPIIAARMDGAPRLSAGIAANKAYTVAGFGGMPTGAWWDAIKDDPALANGITHTPRLIVFGGGVGVFDDGQLVGTIGVSGGSADQDAEVATAGASVFS